MNALPRWIKGSVTVLTAAVLHFICHQLSRVVAAATTLETPAITRHQPSFFLYRPSW
jgi:hypothetical protein